MTVDELIFQIWYSISRKIFGIWIRPAAQPNNPVKLLSGTDAWQKHTSSIQRAHNTKLDISGKFQPRAGLPQNLADFTRLFLSKTYCNRWTGSSTPPNTYQSGTDEPVCSWHHQKGWKTTDKNTCRFTQNVLITNAGAIDDTDTAMLLSEHFVANQK
jgi:hypothetical protein